MHCEGEGEYDPPRVRMITPEESFVLRALRGRCNFSMTLPKDGYDSFEQGPTEDIESNEDGTTKLSVVTYSLIGEGGKQRRVVACGMQVWR